MSAANTALAGLYEAHADELHGFARRRAGRQEAEDVVQDTYLHLLQRGNAATLEHPRAYLFRITANLAVDLARKARIRLRYADDGFEFDSNADTPPDPEAAAIVRSDTPSRAAISAWVKSSMRLSRKASRQRGFSSERDA